MTRLQVCCKDLWYLEVAPPSPPARVQLVRASTQSLELSWTSIPNAQYYILEVQKLPTQANIPPPPVPIANMAPAPALKDVTDPCKSKTYMSLFEENLLTNYPHQAANAQKAILNRQLPSQNSHLDAQLKEETNIKEEIKFELTADPKILQDIKLKREDEVETKQEQVDHIDQSDELKSASMIKTLTPGTNRDCV